MGWGTLLEVLNKLLNLFESFLFKRRQKEIEDVIKDAEKDPTGAFNKHFNGVPTASKASSTEADKADTSSS
jgi:hypothetical protein